MKRVLFVLATAGLMSAGSIVAAQSIAPECAVSAASAGLDQGGYDVVFDAQQGVCVAMAAGTEATVSSQAAPAGGLLLGGGVGTMAAFAGLAALTFVGVSSTGGT
ncbi:MAG: hypothetical protein ACXIU8_08520 [Alkalilacustris sp.]